MERTKICLWLGETSTTLQCTRSKSFWLVGFCFHFLCKECHFVAYVHFSRLPKCTANPCAFRHQPIYYMPKIQTILTFRLPNGRVSFIVLRSIHLLGNLWYSTCASKWTELEKTSMLFNYFIRCPWRKYCQCFPKVFRWK